VERLLFNRVPQDVVHAGTGDPPGALAGDPRVAEFLAHRFFAVAPERTPLRRERAQEPYSEAELARYLALADAQRTAARRARVSGLIALGAGAGLIGADLRAVTGSDVVCRLAAET
jgi:hypothetical protein